jgi:DNA-binding FadR family transcriptional regulator
MVTPRIAEIESTPLHVPKIAELVAADLRKRIARGDFSEGDELPPGTILMQRYGVSRPTLREALRVLESENLITVRRGAQGGAEVRLPSATVAARYAGLLLQLRGATLDDVSNVRSIVEPALAGMVAARPKRVVVPPLKEALAQEAATMSDTIAFGKASIAFHHTVAELSGNTTLRAVIDLLDSVIAVHLESRQREESRRKGAVVSSPKEIKASHRSHVRLVELVEAGDVTGAEEHWRTHDHTVGAWLNPPGRTQRVVDLF